MRYWSVKSEEAFQWSDQILHFMKNMNPTLMVANSKSKKENLYHTLILIRNKINSNFYIYILINQLIYYEFECIYKKTTKNLIGEMICIYINKKTKQVGILICKSELMWVITCMCMWYICDDGVAEKMTHMSHISISKWVLFCLTITYAWSMTSNKPFHFYFSSCSILQLPQKMTSKTMPEKFLGLKHMFFSKIPLSLSQTHPYIHTYIHTQSKSFTHLFFIIIIINSLHTCQRLVI